MRDCIYTPMTFGKHKGLPVNEVRTGYLLWCYDSLPYSPDYILKELERRGVKLGQSWLEKRVKQPSKKTSKRTQKKPAAVPKFMAEIAGRDYQRLREEFGRCDGDEGDCPFGEEYMGPTICWSGSVPSIRPSEMPRRYW